jgi:hypothetical protein
MRVLSSLCIPHCSLWRRSDLFDLVVSVFTSPSSGFPSYHPFHTNATRAYPFPSLLAISTHFQFGTWPRLVAFLLVFGRSRLSLFLRPYWNLHVRSRVIPPYGPASFHPAPAELSLLLWVSLTCRVLTLSAGSSLLIVASELLPIRVPAL